MGYYQGMRDKTFCGARTRRGTSCKCAAIETKLGKWRCKLHGGLSSGPKTAEGRARIAEAQRRRWAAVLKRDDAGREIPHFDLDELTRLALKRGRRKAQRF
jgi:hypothetical protein